MADIKIASDSGKLYAGANSDLEIYNNDSHSFISNATEGHSIVLRTRASGGSTADAVTIGADKAVALTGSLSVRTDQNSETSISIQNADTTSTGAGHAELLLKNSNGNVGGLRAHSSGFSTSNFSEADGFTIESYRQILHLAASNDKAIKLWSGTSNVMTLDGNSRVSLSNNDSGGTSGADSTSGNTFFGYLAGQHSENGSHNNTLIGHKAAGGASWANFENNVVIGTNAGAAATEADQCVIIGQNAGTAITGSEDLVLVGQGAGSSLTDNVDKVVFIGRNAGATTNSNNAVGTVGIGHSALTALTSGAGNTAIGYKAGEDITDADYNTLIGYEAGANIISGHSNICIGREAGKSLDNSDHNIAIGRDAMNDSTHDDSKYNIGIGSYTLDAIGGNLAEKNIAIGYQAGSGITTGDDNTIVGYRAGQVTTELAGGIDNTLIGSGAITSAPGGNNQTVVGAHTSGQADNSVTLGNASVTAVYAAQDKDAIVYCGGIQFDDAGEQLDDYEEGTWQPAFSTGAGTITAHASASLGSYTKIGNICHVQAHIQVSSISTSPYPSGAARITGLPFTIDNNTGGEDSSVATGTVWVHGMSGALNVLQIAGQAHTSQVIVSEMDGENNSDDASSHLGDTNLQLRIAMIIKCA